MPYFVMKMQANFFLGKETAVESTQTGTSFTHKTTFNLFTSTKSMPFGLYTSNTPKNSTISAASLIISTLISYTIDKSEVTGTNTTTGLRIYDILAFSVSHYVIYNYSS